MPEGHLATGTCRGTLLGDHQANAGEEINIKEGRMTPEGEGSGSEVRERAVL